MHNVQSQRITYQLNMKKFDPSPLKELYLAIRRMLFGICEACTFGMRRKSAATKPGIKILVICQLRLGDNVVSEPTLRAIKGWNKEGELVALSNKTLQEFFAEINSVDRVVVDFGKGFLNLIRTIRMLREEYFDLVIDFTSDYTIRPALIAFFCKSGYTIGYNIQGRGFLFNKPVLPFDHGVHESEEIAHLVKSLGINVPDVIPKIEMTAKKREKLHDYLGKENIGEKDVVIGIHPGGHYYTQRWPAHDFALLADRLYDKTKIVLLGAKTDMELVNNIKGNMRNKPIIFCSNSVRSLIAALRRCNLLVCNNSGPLHLAAALGVPTVSTMGPTDPQKWWPLGENNMVIRKNLPCMPCNSGRCRIKTHACMKQITVEEMEESVHKLLAKTK